MSEIEGAAARYLPHRGPALLIRKVIASSAEETVCIGSFPVENALNHEGRVAAFNTVEAAAQAAATHQAIRAVADGIPITHLEGFLTGFKHMELGQQSIPVDTDLRVRVIPRGGARGLYKFRFEVHLGEELIAKGELSTYVQAQA